MERLVEVSDQEVRIDFALHSKCRANVRLRSLITTAPVAFKVQTSSSHKFLVNPPSGLIPPSSYATVQVILNSQTQLPPTFPRSPSDRFLIKTAVAPEFTHNSSESTHPESINFWFSSRDPRKLLPMTSSSRLRSWVRSFFAMRLLPATSTRLRT
ncbi:hypothetical protein L1049_011689 [Liquidambar formosana]|uniref:MSP domain-containing protein n=1 Tax=Liquidambar formosana TaxID=63359 RepID=A0AAP0RRW2_LIQFO